MVYPKVKPFRFWSQKVLPLVYDDSLSYYEVLCKLVHKVNKIIEIINAGGSVDEYGQIYYVSLIDDLKTFLDANPKGVLFVDKDIDEEDMVFPENLMLMFTDGKVGDCTINGEIVPVRKQIFKTDANVTIDKTKNAFGYPEYFGAIINNESIDCSIAINKAIEAFNEVVLNYGDYCIHNPIRIARSYIKLTGSGTNQQYYPTSVGRGSRIVAIGCSGIELGDTTYNVSYTTCTIKDLSITNKNPDYSEERWGLRTSYYRMLVLDNITISNFKYGYYIDSIVLSYFNRIRFLSNKPSADNNRCYGVYLNLNAKKTGISPISSLYIENGDVEFANLNLNNIGVYGIGENGISDTIFNKLNTYQCGRAVVINSEVDNIYQQNLWFYDCCFDNSGQYGVEFIGNIKGGLVGCHITMGNWGETNAVNIAILRCTNEGGVIISNCYLKCSNTFKYDTYTCYGIQLQNSQGCVVNGVITTEIQSPVLVSYSTNCTVDIMCNNTVADFANKYGIAIENSEYCYGKVKLSGNKKYQGGILCRDNTTYCSFDCGNLDRDLAYSALVVEGTPLIDDLVIRKFGTGNYIIGSLF